MSSSSSAVGTRIARSSTSGRPNHVGEIPERPEQDAVVVASVRVEVLEQARQRAGRSRGTRLLLRRRLARSREHALAQLAESIQVARTIDGESQHLDRPVLRPARRQHVRPGDVVGRAAGQHGDIVTPAPDVARWRGNALRIRRWRADRSDGRRRRASSRGGGGIAGPCAGRRVLERAEPQSQAGMIGRERLHARHQREVHPILHAEVLERVLEKPACERQQEPALHEDDGARRPLRADGPRGRARAPAPMARRAASGMRSAWRSSRASARRNSVSTASNTA